MSYCTLLSHEIEIEHNRGDDHHHLDHHIIIIIIAITIIIVCCFVMFVLGLLFCDLGCTPSMEVTRK